MNSTKPVMTRGQALEKIKQANVGIVDPVSKVKLIPRRLDGGILRCSLFVNDKSVERDMELAQIIRDLQSGKLEFYEVIPKAHKVGGKDSPSPSSTRPGYNHHRPDSILNKPWVKPSMAIAILTLLVLNLILIGVVWNTRSHMATLMENDAFIVETIRAEKINDLLDSGMTPEEIRANGIEL